MTDNNQNSALKYLKDVKVAEKLAEIYKKYNIEQKKTELVEEQISKVLEQKIDKHDLAGVIEDKANIDFDTAMDLSFDIIDKIIPLLPVEIKDRFVSKIKREKINSEDIIEEIKKEAEIKIAKELEKRFSNIILNWFRGIRDDQETQSILTRSQKVGGLGLEFKQAKFLIEYLKQKQQDFLDQNIEIAGLISQQELESQKIKQKEEVEDVDIDVSAVPPEAEEKKVKLTGADVTIGDLLKEKHIEFKELAHKEQIKQQLSEEKYREEVMVEEIDKQAKVLVSQMVTTKPDPKRDTVVEPKKLAPPPPAIRQQSITPPQSAQPVVLSQQVQPTSSIPATAGEVKPPEIKPVQTFESATAKPEIKKTLIQNKEDNKTGRPKVEDVKFATKLYGPIEELGSLTVADFRRLAKDPQEAATRIMDKLELLEDQSIIEKVKGIKALKSSPLYKVYADIMNRAIKEGQSFEKIIAEKDDLTIEEFKAIMELNKSLKY